MLFWRGRSLVTISKPTERLNSSFPHTMSSIDLHAPKWRHDKPQSCVMSCSPKFGCTCQPSTSRWATSDASSVWSAVCFMNTWSIDSMQHSFRPSQTTERKLRMPKNAWLLWFEPFQRSSGMPAKVKWCDIDYAEFKKKGKTLSFIKVEIHVGPKNQTPL